jgi:copper chaperone
MTHTVQIENLKCGGCANTIKTSLSAMPGVSGVQVDTDAGAVAFDADESQVPAVKSKLHSLGYPESGTVAGLGAVASSAKSYVSCAIGRIRPEAA